MHQLKHGVKIVSCIFLMIFSMMVTALESDKEKVANVAADFARLSQKAHQGEYKGNVRVEQGTTNLRAALAVTKGNKKNELTLAIAKGDKKHQAHYWTMTDSKKPLLHAYADAIYYYPLKNLIKLIGNARVIQGENVFKATTISYNTKEEHVVSESGWSSQSTIIFYPEKKIS